MSIALCLSGGGFRAALYHLGVLKRLHELDLLHDVQMVAAVSGGALTAALFQQSVTGYEPAVEGEHDGRIRYRWEAFEASLLDAARRGLLDLYFSALVLHLLLWLALLSWGLWLWQENPRGTLAAIAMAASIATLSLFLWLLPFALDHVRAMARIASIRAGVGGPFESYGRGRGRSLVQAVRQALSPSAMRTATLALELFDHGLLGMLRPHPAMYLGSIELNRGLEMVFSQTVLAGLNSQGAVALWEQRPGYGADSSDYIYRTYDVSGLPVADAVAASSAYPPFFPPIALALKSGHGVRPASFTDGGILDNAALNIVFALFNHCSDRRSRYTREPDEHGRRIGNVGFGEAISHVFIADAGAPPRERWRRFWSSASLLWRVFKIMFSSQTTTVANLADVLRHHGQLRVTQIAHWIEFPAGHPLCDTGIAPLLGWVRTHFDQFDAIETSLLVYSGYFWTDQALAGRGRTTAACKGFAEIAREVTGSEAVARLAPEAMRRHLRFSHLRWSVMRWLGRALAG